MEVHPSSFQTGYSPDISAELNIRGRRFEIASLSSQTVVVRAPRTTAAGRGTIRMKLDGIITVYRIDLTQGIDTGRREQPFHLLDATDEAAA